MSESESFDATALAAEATSDPVEDLAAEHGEAAAPSSPPDVPNVFARLFDGTAQGPSMGELRQQYDLPRGLTMALRGTLRVADTGGIPPLFDIIGGTALTLRSRATAGSSSTSSDGDRPSGVPGRE
ncbi:hypothetical protein [Halomarina oriensis]|uniref:Uncharacterized protein n=1 Tax=Halomarina oriensis TaxID=671145 RepID=A0A6B0GHG3_9EURY|nr:hypothetical protein [Halomarina oriensis]MWG34164.1 hypothetical protein [Halomarina oriensis]